jgi:hypothetical protein
VSVTLHAAADRVRRLADTLGGLKDRVRAAVAGEAGRAVADAVRDLLTAALAGRTPPPADPYRPAYPATPRPRWDDADDPDRDGWADREDDDRFTPAGRGRWRDADDEPAPRPTAVPPTPPAHWPAAVALGAGVVRWWAARRVPTWAAVGVGLLAGAAALAGGPLARAGLALLAAACDLLPLAAPPTALD